MKDFLEVCLIYLKELIPLPFLVFGYMKDINYELSEAMYFTALLGITGAVIFNLYRDYKDIY
ncbi:MAG: hypothetical protein K2X86_07145 [Cytophagaceae bacterium]|nr:hypothetical protein [Cytophagaceae bacterium]